MFGAGLRLEILDDPRPVIMTTSANFLGDVPDLDHMPDRLRLGDERAAARAAYDDSRRLQFAKRPICGHARDFKFLDKLCFRRDAITRLQPTVPTPIRNTLLERGIAGRD